MLRFSVTILNAKPNIGTGKQTSRMSSHVTQSYLGQRNLGQGMTVVVSAQENRWRIAASTLCHKSFQLRPGRRRGYSA